MSDLVPIVKVFEQTPMAAVRLYLHKNPKISARGLDQLASVLEKKKVVKAEEGEEGAVPNTGKIHPGIQCDRSGTYPLVGPRFNLGNDDVCESQLHKLKENERCKYTRIEPPTYVKHDEKQWGVLPRLEQISLDNPEQCAASVRLKAVCEKRGIELSVK